MGNSSVVRYCQLFDSIKSISYYSNRGTSGIDGSLSTACGASIIAKDKCNIVIIGDLSFFYDSNALWSRYLNQNLRIISKIVSVSEDRAEIEMWLESEDGKVCAKGEGLFVAVTEGHPAYHRWH